MREKHSSSGAICQRKHFNCNNDVKLDIVDCNQRGECVTGSACACQAPETVMLTILKKAFETKVLQLNGTVSVPAVVLLVERVVQHLYCYVIPM
jgi:hypothetical protein